VSDALRDTRRGARRGTNRGTRSSRCEQGAHTIGDNDSALHRGLLSVATRRTTKACRDSLTSSNSPPRTAGSCAPFSGSSARTLQRTNRTHFQLGNRAVLSTGPASRREESNRQGAKFAKTRGRNGLRGRILGPASPRRSRRRGRLRNQLLPAPLPLSATRKSVPTRWGQIRVERRPPLRNSQKCPHAVGTNPSGAETPSPRLATCS
jgi:hypothetical protein